MVKNKYPLPFFDVIEVASKGDVLAVKNVLRYYHRYTMSLSAYPFFDVEMKRRMESKLMSRILKFKVLPHDKKNLQRGDMNT